MTLSDIILDIQRRETDAALSPELEARVRDVADEFGVDANPSWLLPIFEAVQQGRIVTPPTFFPYGSSDPHSFLAEIILVLGWKAHQEGEYDLLEFPRLGRRVDISHEALSPDRTTGGSSYEVTAL
jgi:hypothetical protein